MLAFAGACWCITCKPAPQQREHQQAQEAHAGCAEEAQILQERIDAAQRRVTELRALAVDRALTDQEACEVNLRLMDLAAARG